MPANEALWTTNDLLPGSSYPRVLFHKHLKLLRTAYQRFKALASMGESMSLHLDQRARFEQVWSLNPILANALSVFYDETYNHH